MNPTINQFGNYNEQQDIVNLFRDYLMFCSDEQNTMNNILHTQNLISNNRYSMFNQMMRFARPEQNTPPTWNFPTFTSTIPNRTLQRPRRRPPRIFQFPIRSTNTSTNTTINPLQEFINETMNNTTPIRRPLSLRSFLDNANVFNYSIDISYNQTRCPITMTDFSNNDLCIRLPCNHIFKYRPLLQWFTVNRTCPMCRANISSINNNRNRTNRDRNNIVHGASIQTTDISNGFIADVSANSLEELTSAITSTVSNRLRNIFQNMDSSANNLAWATNISLDIPNRDNRQSPIILHNQLDISDNLV